MNRVGGRNKAGKLSLLKEKKMKKHIFLFLIAFSFLFCFLYGSQRQQELPPEKHKVEVRLVMVDVIVTKDGKFVTDLKLDEIELYEDGVRVPINSLELVSFAERKIVSLEEKPEKKISPRVPAKKLAVVVDGVNSEARHIRQGAKKIVDEVISLVKLGHEVMIIHLNAVKGVEILQPFTTDEELVRGAVEKAAGDLWVDKALDSLRMAKDVGTEGSGDQARGQRQLGKDAIAGILLADFWQIQKRRFEISVGGILAVFHMIKELPGRKSILLISDGLPELPARALAAVKVFDPFNDLKQEKNLDGYEIIQELIRYANAQNISIYTLDPGTFTEYFFTITIESDEDNPAVPIPTKGTLTQLKKEFKLNKVGNLRWISEDTGAAWLRGAKKYKSFRKILSTDLNYYYQLSYYPPRKKPDNKDHKIEVKVKRPGVSLRHRKGYKDYSEEEEARILIASALYYPELYKDLPFEAEFIPFNLDLNKYRAWMSVALPVKELFKERAVAYGSKIFNLHIWVKDKDQGESSYRGQINIPLNIDSFFMDLAEVSDYFSFHFTGPEVEFSQREYQVIYALYDDQTEEIGTWEQSFSLPDTQENKRGAIINCVLVSTTPNPDGGKEVLSLSEKGGSLEYGEMKFFPAVTNRFQDMQETSVFLQAYLPQGKDDVSPEFTLLKEDSVWKNLPGELVAESWNEKSKVWSVIFNLNIENVAPGDYTLQMNLPLTEKGPVLSKEVRLIKLQY